MNYITVTVEPSLEVIEADGVSVVYVPDDLQAVEVTAASELLTDNWVEVDIIESALQGPPGPPGASGVVYPAKRMTYVGGELTEVLMYSDTAATALAERMTLTRSAGLVTAVTYRDPAGVVLKTRSLTYTDGALTGVTET